MRLKGDKCSRCATQSDLYPFRWTDSITYRGKVIERAWLCLKCTNIEKGKLWEGR